MWPNVCTSSPRAREDRCLIAAGQPPQVVAVGVAGADRHDLDPLLPRGHRLIHRAFRGIGVSVGQDHDVPLAIGGDELPARHLQRIGQVGASLGFQPVDRSIQPPHVAGRRRLQRHQARKRDQADFHRREITLRKEFPGSGLGLDQRLAGHARRNSRSTAAPDQLGRPARGWPLRRQTQPR